MLRYPITITIDTNIFESEKYDLSENSRLQILLKHVKEGKIIVVLSDIVLREIKAHLEKNASQIYSQIRKNRGNLLKISNENLIHTVGLDEYITIPQKDRIIKQASDIFDSYISELAKEVLDVKNVNLCEIVDDYFDIRPPFQDGEKKRKEFPDAFIVNELKQRFPDGDSLIILSNDEGLIKGCHRYYNYRVINSLYDLLKKISEDDEQYKKVLHYLKNAGSRIKKRIREQIENDDVITVTGQSYDSDGIVSGHEYSETYLHKLINLSHNLYIIDDIDADVALITLSCQATLEMDCYYEDYDNAPWDGEEKEYVYVDTIHILERHTTEFESRIKINLNNRIIELLPLHISLDESTRTESLEINDHDDYENDYDERNDLDLQPLNRYGEYADRILREHEINVEIPSLLEKYKSELSIFEELSGVCDEFLEKFNSFNDKEKVLIKLKNELDKIELFNLDLPDEYSEEAIGKWLEEIIEKTELYDEIEVPEFLEFDNEYYIRGITNDLIIGIESLSTDNLSEGDRETARIYAEDDDDTHGASGTIGLTVGYYRFNEDMCVMDSEEDDLSIEYFEIKSFIENYILEQEKVLSEYGTLLKMLNDLNNAF